MGSYSNMPLKLLLKVCSLGPPSIFKRCIMELQAENEETIKKRITCEKLLLQVNNSGLFLIMRATNISFSKVIKLGDRLREFNFRKIPGSDNYSINVSDDKGQRILFNLLNTSESNWVIEGQNLPLWLQFSESVLGSAIEENLE